MSFSVSFWNVENFKGRSARSRKVEACVRSLTGRADPPDIISFCEIHDKTLMRELLTKNFEEYDFAVSDTAIIPRRGRRRFTVRVQGWNQLLGDARALRDFEKTLSDLSALYFEVRT